MSAEAGATPAAGLHLRRTLTLWNLIVIGIVIIQPIAPMGIYGVINNAAGGHVVTTILVALIAMFFTAISYGKMARVYPSAGSAYTYVGQEIHSGLGYLTGWAMVMDYILNPLICTIICAKLTQNILPELPYWVLAIFFAGFFTFLNLGGVKTSARINEVFAAGMTVVVVIFFAFVIRFVWGYHERGAHFFVEPFYNPQTFSFARLGRGTSLAVLTYIGFDGISTFSEEVENPKKNIMLATVIVCILAGVLSAVEVYAAQLVWGSGPFPADKVESAFPLVAQRIGGFFLFHLLNFTVLIANMGSGMASQLAAARLLYGMGRNDAIHKGFFGKVQAKRRIPANNVVFIGALAVIGGLLAIWPSVFSYEKGAAMLNFGALIAFMGVNAAAFVHYYLRGQEKKIGDLLMPVIGFVVCGAIWWNLSPPAKIAGSIWLALGVAYGAWKTNFFRKEMSFEVPPEE
ncbi:MAG: APC family permease [Candidatus Acidiferrum sp.]